MTCIFKKDGSFSKVALDLLTECADVIKNDIVADKTRFHLVTYYGSGRRTTAARGKYNAMMVLLDKIHVPYTTGNDAPRGGASGDYIEVNRLEFVSTVIPLLAK